MQLWVASCLPCETGREIRRWLTKTSDRFHSVFLLSSISSAPFDLKFVASLYSTLIFCSLCCICCDCSGRGFQCFLTRNPQSVGVCWKGMRLGKKQQQENKTHGHTCSIRNDFSLSHTSLSLSLSRSLLLQLKSKAGRQMNHNPPNSKKILSLFSLS